MDFLYFDDFPNWLEASLSLSILLILAFLSQPILLWVITKSFNRWRLLIKTNVVQILLNPEVGKRVSQMSPSILVQITISLIPHLNTSVATVIKNVAVAVTILHTIRIITAILDAVQIYYSNSVLNSTESTRPIKSYLQLGKILIIGLGSIIIIAALIDRSPAILLSGLGAMSAVLLIVFKDTLVSFTAGIQLTTNDMLRVGDWIEMPELGADGDVVDIALHTVKVQNFDKTITSIPTWRLMSYSFKNWRGMSESGGRRIKRTILIDATSVKFIEKHDVDDLKNISLINSYLNEKSTMIEDSNKQLAEKSQDFFSKPVNHRRLTNLGTFRAYVNFYLLNHKKIHTDMTRLVRMLKPDSEGIPLEIYCFTSTTDWIEYENIQSDVFEHLLAILPEFGLRTFQKPSGHDFASVNVDNLR
ncbi:MAG: mechanosensitive ion channel protein MscS [Betaproteobacteria bacterium TMED41]|nr:MAG: mechanosensitive ion channel protein MscS [Betaproteobacteria bacterium TMED41]